MNRRKLLGKCDWRLPNRGELRSLISHQSRRPALPEQHPFLNVFQGWYWTSTTAVITPTQPGMSIWRVAAQTRGSGVCRILMNWKRWLIAAVADLHWLSPRIAWNARATSTGHRPPVPTSPIGRGPCTWTRAPSASVTRLRRPSVCVRCATPGRIRRVRHSGRMTGHYTRGPGPVDI